MFATMASSSASAVSKLAGAASFIGDSAVSLGEEELSLLILDIPAGGADFGAVWNGSIFSGASPEELQDYSGKRAKIAHQGGAGQRKPPDSLGFEVEFSSLTHDITASAAARRRFCFLPPAGEV
jgi:hypothetical protein